MNVMSITKVWLSRFLLIAIIHLTIYWLVEYYIGAQVGIELANIINEAEINNKSNNLENQLSLLYDKTAKWTPFQHALSLPMQPLWGSCLNNISSEYIYDPAKKGEIDSYQMRNRGLTIAAITSLFNSLSFSLLAVAIWYLIKLVSKRRAG